MRPGSPECICFGAIAQPKLSLSVRHRKFSATVLVDPPVAVSCPSRSSTTEVPADNALTKPLPAGKYGVRCFRGPAFESSGWGDEDSGQDSCGWGLPVGSRVPIARV